MATGYENEPVIPDWSGREHFKGRLLHSREYKNPEPFHGQQVLVVGPGCSGMEIAYDLAEGGAAKVWLSARTPPNIMLREGPGSFPGDMIAVALLRTPVRFADAFTRFGRRMDLGDLTEYGLPIPDEGVFARMHRLGVAPAIVDKEVIEAIKAGRIEVVRGVESLDATAVQLADGERVEPDAVICATGYRRGLEPLVGHLGVLGERGRRGRSAGAGGRPGCASSATCRGRERSVTWPRRRSAPRKAIARDLYGRRRLTQTSRPRGREARRRRRTSRRGEAQSPRGR